MSCLTYRSLFICSLISFCGLFADSQSASAQIVPDQTTATEVKGNAIAPLGSGTVSGGNLYHSFDQFNVPKAGVTFSTGSSTVDGGKIDNILNRVTGENPSQILGTIESRAAFPNANLYLMNPNGVVFGKDARLDIGGSFKVNTGTSLGFTGDRQFSADKAKLDFPSGDPQNIKFGISQPAAIINQGNLTVDAGKSITFTAGSVINSGVLTAPSGNVALTSVTGGSLVDLRSPDLVIGLSVAKDAVPTDWNGQITTLPKLAELLTGKAIEGDRVVVKPDGTLAIMTTLAADQVPVTNGTTVISGSINTSSVNADGGKVGIFGDRVALINSQISATGINGGKVLIGGDFQGNGVVPNAEFTYFDRNSIVNVSALTNGNGGKVIIWGDRLTQFFGTILSKGGFLSGDGGFVEVSGKENLLYRGNVDTSVTNGNLGTLLLDPTNITIVSGDPSNDIQLSPDVPNIGDPAFAIFFNDVITNNFTISNTLLNLATSNIILQALNDINVNAPVNIAAPNISFTAQAGNNINVNQDITTNRGNISLLANNGATATGTGSIQLTTGVNSSITTNGGNFTSTGFNFGNITSINTTSSTGGGNIDINVTGAINANPSTLLSGVASSGTGNAGNITLKALGSIQASALQAADGVGANVINGGNVTLDAGGNITIGTLGSISTRSTSGGKAGDVLLKSGGSITALGTTGINASVIGSSVGGSQAGNVTFDAGTTINTDAAIATSINSNTVTGNAGNITFTANQNISAIGDLIAANLGTGNAGKIDVISNNDSSITRNIVAGSLATAGDVTLRALNNITIGYILGLGGTQGSNVTLTATNGNITISSTGSIPSTLFGINLDPCGGSNICTAATNGTGGNISLSTGGDFAINAATAFVSGGGKIAVSGTSVSGNSPITFNTSSAVGGGDVDINITGDIDLANTAVFNTLGTSGSPSGAVAIKSTNGSISVQDIVASSTTGSARELNLTASANITANNISTNVRNPSYIGDSGNITLNAGGAIEATGTIFTANLGTGKSGDIKFTAGGNINAGFLVAGGFFSGNGNAGSVELTSTTGNITAAEISTGISDQCSTASCVGLTTAEAAIISAVTNSTGSAGNITVVSSGDVQLTATDASVTETGATGNAGKINITSQNGSIISSGNITSGSLRGSGNGNDINLSSKGGVTATNVASGSAFSNGSGGNIQIIADSINVGSLIASALGGGSSGNVTLSVANNVTAGFILNLGNTKGGDVSITSTSGTIQIPSTVPSSLPLAVGANLDPCVGSNICTAARNGIAGNITIAGNLSLSNPTQLLSTGTLTGGAINLQNTNINGTQNLTLDSGSGTVNLGNIGATTNLGTLTINAGSVLANQAIAASAIALNTTGNITTQLLDTSSNAGSVSLTSATGAITFAGINTRRNNDVGNGGDINIQANGDITSTGVVSFAGIPSIFSLTTSVSDTVNGNIGNGGAISLISTNGSIDTQSGTISTTSSIGGGGNISLSSPSGSITTGSIETSGNSSGSTTLSSRDAIAVLGNINTGTSFNNGGLISLTSNTGAIATGDLSTNGLFQGGNILIDALTQIDVGRVNSSSLFGSGGSVTLDPIGNVTFTTIDATGNTTLDANGGNVNIVSTGGNVLGTGQLLDSISICDGATICTNGTGTVSIQHGITSPFNLNTFLVNSTGILNGTVGSIVTGAGSLLSFTGIPNGAGAFTQGNISITPGQGVFIPPVVPPVTPPVVPPVTPPSPPAEPNGTQIITPINPIIVASISPIIVGSTDFPFLDVSKISNAKAGEYLALGNFEEAFNEIEKGHLSAYENYLGETLTPQVKNIEQLQQELEEVSQLSGSATTVIYPIILDDRLELMIIPPKGMGKPFREFVTQAKESEIVPVILDFANNVRDSSSQDFLEQSQQLYNWLVRPYRDRLQTLQDRYQPTNTQANPKQLSETEKQPKEKLPPTLVFVMDGGLRVIPVAALHDGKQFLIEKYALANLPYLRVSRLENRDRNLNSILAMGLTESMQGFSALPSVKIEVSTISSQALKSSFYLDQEFTISNLQDKRRQGDFSVLHLATHAQFVSNDAKGAFIQFWNERLSIDRVPSLRFDSPLVEMLTLSACQTAVGQNLGLGGLAISSGAKSVLASLWEVADSGTAPLMIQFYNSFPENITKAIALQRAQIDMLSGKVRIENGNILGIPRLPAIPLSKLNSDEINLKHPFFWSSFILIGNWL